MSEKAGKLLSKSPFRGGKGWTGRGHGGKGGIIKKD